MTHFKNATKMLLLCMLIAACNQAPLFYYISIETAPIEPIIKGAPSEIVELGSPPKLYVSNSTIW
jgi:hypothetical protein